MEVKGCLSCIGVQKDVITKLTAMKTTQQKQAKTNNSVEKCEKKTWKPFNP